MKTLLNYYAFVSIMIVMSCSSDGDPSANLITEGDKKFSFDQESLNAFISDQAFKRFSENRSDKSFASETICDGIGGYNIDGDNNFFDFTNCYYQTEYVEDDYYSPEYYLILGGREFQNNSYIQLSIAFVNLGIPQTGNYSSTYICGVAGCDFINYVTANITIYSCTDNFCNFEKRFFTDIETFNVDVVNRQGKIQVSFNDTEFYENFFWPQPGSEFDESFYNRMRVSSTLECCLEN